MFESVTTFSIILEDIALYSVDYDYLLLVLNYQLPFREMFRILLWTYLLHTEYIYNILLEVKSCNTIKHKRKYSSTSLNLCTILLDSVKVHKPCLLYWNLIPLLQYWCNLQWRRPLLDSFLVPRWDQDLKRVYTSIHGILTQSTI